MILPRTPPGCLPTQAASGMTPRYSGQRGLQQRMVIAAQGTVRDSRGGRPAPHRMPSTRTAVLGLCPAPHSWGCQLQSSLMWPNI